MKKLRVLVSFRDENNFFLLHKTGDVIFVEENRASRLVKGGLCEVIEEPDEAHKAPASVPAEEKKEETYVEETPVEEATKEQPSEEPAEAQPVKRQYRRRKTE